MAHVAEHQDGGENTDDNQTHAQRSANLARIRDNQRRSRARRKDYLQELEAKYRHCEQMGVEASAEIQTAARRVVEENKRLRQLLKQQGMSDAEIDAMAVEMPEQPHYSTAATSLEARLGAKRPCCGSTSSGSTNSSNATDHRPTVTNTLPPLQAQYSAPQRQPAIATPNPQFASPHSSISSGVITPSTMHFPAPSPLQGFALPAASRSSVSYGDMQYDNSFGWQPRNHSVDVAEGGSSSCYVAADAIRNIKPDAGYELETELGCSDGKECSVPNSQIFAIMDRYTD